jgi:hypothetical protein
MSWWFSHPWSHVSQITDQKEKTEGAKGKLSSSHGKYRIGWGWSFRLGLRAPRRSCRGEKREGGGGPSSPTASAHTPPHLSLLTALLSPPTSSSGIRRPNPAHPPQTPPLRCRLPFPTSLLRSVAPATPILVAVGHGGRRHEVERARRRRCTARGGRRGREGRDVAARRWSPLCPFSSSFYRCADGAPAEALLLLVRALLPPLPG